MGENTGSVKDLINLTENMDCFDYTLGVTDDSDLGYYWLEESGVFTDNGYVCSNGGRFVDIYDSNIENIPEEYRIQIPKFFVRTLGKTKKDME